MKRQCGNCRFWAEEEEECHRYAPRIAVPWGFYGLCLAIARSDDEADEVVGGEHFHDAVFPRTKGWEWCGEHEPKEPA